MLFWLKKFVSYWLMPLPLCLVLILSGLVLLLLAKRTRLARVLMVTGVVLLMLFSNKFVSRWLSRPLETRYPSIPELTVGAPLPALLDGCRFVVVFGGGNGQTPNTPPTSLLSTSALARVVEAVRLLRALPEAKLIVSGPGSGSNPTHATVLARAAQTLGLAADRIIYIDNAHDTEDEVHAVKRLTGDARVALVTSGWHMPRTMALARHVGVNAVACPCDYRSHQSDIFAFDDLFWEVEALGRSTFAIRERIGYVWIWLRGKT